MKYGKLDLDPANSPGVLDTATWDAASACRQVAARAADWRSWYGKARKSSKKAAAAANAAPCRAVGAIQSQGAAIHCLAELDDRQMVFLAIGPAGAAADLGSPSARIALDADTFVLVHPTDAAVIDRYCRTVQPVNAPRPLGRTPRIGIGTRMTTKVWPGIFAAMERRGFAANSVQNSVRELNLLDDLREGRSPERNYAFCFGEIESGYTGSTFEGLWVSGTLAALMHPAPLAWGADADHIQLKRNDPGYSRARRVLEASRYYSFFTLDPADILHYGALKTAGEGAGLLERAIPDARTRRDVLAYHLQPARLGGRAWKMDEDLVGRLVGKFWDSLEGTAALTEHLGKLRGGAPYDLEFAFDENPSDQPVADCVSRDEEVVFVVREIERRNLPVTHVAPNLGVEKGYDYRLPDGLGALEERVRTACRIVGETPFMIDVHSADDLQAPTRKAIGRAGRGDLHYKVSPSLQFVFTEVVAEREPALFRAWWDDAVAYARMEAAKGSPIAAECLAAWESAADRTPSPAHEVFHKFYFAYPGRRDSEGRYANRQRLYELSADLYDEYRDRIAAMLVGIADDIQLQRRKP